VSPDPLVIARAISKTYVTPSGGIEALHSVDAELELGEITAVVGASGSGKSTLLKALAGLDRLTSGSLAVDGASLADAPPSRLRRHRCAVVTYVSQRASDNFIPHLTLYEQDDGRAAAMLREFGLANRIDARPIELSGGEQARAAFALALARGTKLVIADEPTAELDRDSAAPLLDAIRAHAGAGTAFAIATHDDDVIAIADRVLRLDRGRVVTEVGHTGVARSEREEVAVGTPILRARGLRKSFRRGSETVHALRDGTLEVRRGEIAALLGRSGSGKSTLLALLSGLSRPDGGELGIEPGSRLPAELPWRELAFLPQRFGLLPELSVRENVELPARLASTWPSGENAAAALLDRLGLAELASRPPHEISIGQQQRTALARALVLAPSLLLADEPTAHQDAGWRDAVWQLLSETAASGTATLVATHEEEVARYVDRVWQVDSGVVECASIPA
jgi:putative ABC transport system ATP-binding protein